MRLRDGVAGAHHRPRARYCRHAGVAQRRPSARAVEVETGDAMGQTLVQVAPLAIAAALSSVPISATIFILLSESRTRSGLAFLAGTVLGAFATVALATVAGQALPGRPRQHEALVARLEVVIGLAMVLLGVMTLLRRNRAVGGGSAGLAGRHRHGRNPARVRHRPGTEPPPEGGAPGGCGGPGHQRRAPAVRREPRPRRRLHRDRHVHGRRPHRRDDPVSTADGASPRRGEGTGSPHTPPRSVPRC